MGTAKSKSYLGPMESISQKILRQFWPLMVKANLIMSYKSLEANYTSTRAGTMPANKSELSFTHVKECKMFFLNSTVKLQ